MVREHGEGGQGGPVHGEPVVASQTWPTHPTDFPTSSWNPTRMRRPGQSSSSSSAVGSCAGGRRGGAWYGDVRGVWPSPRGGVDAAGDVGGYIDGYLHPPTRPHPARSLSERAHRYGGANSWRGGFMLGATLYLRDVQPQGGGFVWPRSHAAVHATSEHRLHRRALCDAPGVL